MGNRRHNINMKKNIITKRINRKKKLRKAVPRKKRVVERAELEKIRKKRKSDRAVENKKVKTSI